MVTIRTDAELRDAYTLLEEMGARCLKMIVTDGVEDTSFIAPSEEFERLDLEQDMPEMVEPVEEEKQPKCCPGKKHKKHGKFMKGKFVNKIVDALRQVIREELSYALKSDTPTPVTPEAIHNRVQCDFCDVAPIIGNRYKCMTCPNFDLC